MPGCSLFWGSACSSGSADSTPVNSPETIGNSLQTAPSQSVDAGFCNGHGECLVESMDQQVAKCECEPVWEGERCERPIDWVEFTSRDAMLKYFLQVEPPYQDSRLRLLFLPGSSGSGTLASAVSQSGTAYMRLEINQSVKKPFIFMYFFQFHDQGRIRPSAATDQWRRRPGGNGIARAEAEPFRPIFCRLPKDTGQVFLRYH